MVVERLTVPEERWVVVERLMPAEERFASFEEREALLDERVALPLEVRLFCVLTDGREALLEPED